MTKSRCFVFQEITSPCNLVDLGEIVTVFGDTRPSIFDSEQIENDIADRLEQTAYNPDIDYVVINNANINGTAHLLAVVTSIYGKVKVAMYHPFDKKYILSDMGLPFEESVT